MSNIKSTEIVCKGNVTGNYEQVPMELFDYIELDLISHTEMIIYLKLLQLYNHNEGYAFPTMEQLMIYTNVHGKPTISKGLKNLEKVGLIKKEKAVGWNNKNTYVAYLPLDKQTLYNHYPERVEEREEFIQKQSRISKQDKKRYHMYQKEKEHQQEVNA